NVVLDIIVLQNAQGRAFHVVVLATAQRPEKGGKAGEVSQTGRLVSTRCFDLIFRSAFFAARLMSAAERPSLRLACLNSWGLIGRGFRGTPFPRRCARTRNATIRPKGLSLAGIRYHGANFVDVSSNISSIATT